MARPIDDNNDDDNDDVAEVVGDALNKAFSKVFGEGAVKHQKIDSGTGVLSVDVGAIRTGRHKGEDTKSTQHSSGALPPSMIARRLLDHFADYKNHTPFKQGELVVWKAAMDNRDTPDGPFIVVEVLDEPVIEPKHPVEVTVLGSAYFREPLDIVLGFLYPDHGDLKFITFHHNSHRFERYGGKID